MEKLDIPFFYILIPFNNSEYFRFTFNFRSTLVLIQFGSIILIIKIFSSHSQNHFSLVLVVMHFLGLIDRCTAETQVGKLHDD